MAADEDNLAYVNLIEGRIPKVGFVYSVFIAIALLLIKFKIVGKRAIGLRGFDFQGW